MSQIIFGNGQQAGGILVNPVDDARAQLTVDAGETVPQGVQQAIDQSVILVTGGGMHHQPLGLVDDHHILIFIHNVQGNVTGFHIDFFWLRQGYLHRVARGQTVIFLSRLSVQGDAALVQELLGGGAAQVQFAACQKGIQPFSGGICKKGHFLSSFQICLLHKIRWSISRMQPQLIKQSATLNTGKFINSV